MDKYKVALLTYIRDVGENNIKSIVSCTCKTVRIYRESEQPSHYEYECEGCGNSNLINLNNETRILYPYIEVLNSDGKGFRAKRTNISISIDKNFNLKIKENMVQELQYDIVNKTIEIYKNNSENICTNDLEREKAMKSFFKSVKDNEFISLISSVEMGSLYDVIWKSMSRQMNRYNSYFIGERKIWRGLIYFIAKENTYLQILNNAKYKNLDRFYEESRRNRYYGESNNSNNSNINKEGKNPKEILGLPKFMLEYIRESNVSMSEIGMVKRSLDKMDVNKFREVFSIVKDESDITSFARTIDRMMELYNDYGYTNLKKLTLYLFREIRMTQGMSNPQNGATMLRDYARMATVCGQKYEKYPKSLKKEHDMTMMNYKVQENKVKLKEFEHVVKSNSYIDLEYKKKEFSIIAPSDIGDLSKEGDILNHCIASYLNDVVSMKCKIYFLRDTIDIDTPLVSIEVRGGNVRQAKGYGNRKLKNKENDFMKEWAKSKSLDLNYY